MSVLFARIANNEATAETLQLDAQMCTMEVSDFVTVHYRNTEEEYNQILLEGIRAGYITAQTANLANVIESLSDTVDSIIAWFKKWLKTFKNFIMGVLKKIMNLFVSGESVIKKFDSSYVNFKPFEMEGFEYSINTSDLNSKILSDFMNAVNHYAIEIGYSNPRSLGANLSVYINDISGDTFLDKVRGEMIGTSPIKSSHWKEELKASFRKGLRQKKKIEVTPQVAHGFCKQYEMLKLALDSCKKNKEQMERNVDHVIAWMEGEPMVVRGALDNKEPGLQTASQQHAFREQQYMAAEKLFHAAHMTARQIQYIYDKYYTAKIDALNEAIMFYLKVVNTAFAHAVKEGA